MKETQKIKLKNLLFEEKRTSQNREERPEEPDKVAWESMADGFAGDSDDDDDDDDIESATSTGRLWPFCKKVGVKHGKDYREGRDS